MNHLSHNTIFTALRVFSTTPRSLAQLGWRAVCSTDMSPRVAELDGLRAIAILMVVAWHYLGIPGGQGSAAWSTFIAGRTGVDLFFVLSGYLITAILLKNKASPSYFSTFYLRRAFRILPPYFGMLAIYLIGRQVRSADVLFAGPLPWWSYFAGLQNVWMAIEQSYGAMWLSATWSLAIEEQFYLLFPLAVYFTSERTLLMLLIALIIACPIARAFVASQGDQFAYSVLMPMRADILAVGALIALLRYVGSSRLSSVRLTFRWCFWLCVLLFPAFVLTAFGSAIHMAAWGYSYLVVLYGSVLFMTVDRAGRPETSYLRGVVAAFFARISYSLYLVHGPVLIVVFALAARSAPTFALHEAAYLVILAFLLSIGICWLSYRLIERPLVKMAHQRFNYSDDQRARAPQR